MGNVHVKSLNIETYRGVKNLKLDGFTGVNIFTGDNNCGKTSILELLLASEDPKSPYRWYTIARGRKYPTPTRTPFEAIKDLYDISSPELKIAFSGEDCFSGKFDVVLKGNLSREKTTRDLYCREARIECEKGQEYSEAEMIKLHTDIFHNGTRTDDFDVYNVTRFANFYEYKDKIKFFYISPTLYRDECPFIANIFNVPEDYEKLIKILRIFDDDIISINPTVREYDIPFPVNYSFQILSKNFTKAVPLSVYGDGVKKALWLVCAVIVAKNGVLLIDEFETAIHTSAMTKIYDWILKTCKRLNVQLFLTTHSKEALQKVLALNSEPELKDDITLFTLYKRDGKNIARRLSAEKAIEADENFGLELR